MLTQYWNSIVWSTQLQNKRKIRVPKR